MTIANLSDLRKLHEDEIAVAQDVYEAARHAFDAALTDAPEDEQAEHAARLTELQEMLDRAREAISAWLRQVAKPGGK